MARQWRGPSVRVVERLDNGAMSRPLERPAEAERLHHERNREAEQQKKPPELV